MSSKSTSDVDCHDSSPKKSDLNDILTVHERRKGYTQDGKKKRILLNAFDMNGMGHVRYVAV